MSKLSIPRRAWLSALAIALVAVAANLAIWRVANEPVKLPGFPGKIDGFAFSAFQRYQSPLEGTFPSEAELGRDLRILSRYGKSIRTYASAESDAIPRLAQHYGLEVTAGAWLDRRLANNERELLELKSAAMKFPNIERAIVGNEALLRSDLLGAAADPVPRPGARDARHPGVDCRAVAHVVEVSGARRPRRLHHRAPPAVLGRRTAAAGREGRARTLRRSARAIPEEESRDRRSRLAVERRPLRAFATERRGRSAVPATLLRSRCGAQARLLRHGSVRPAVEGNRRRPRRRVLGHVRRRSRAEILLFVIPVLGFFVNKALFGIILYRVRVPCSWRDALGAAVASMGLSHAIARGVLKGVRTAEHPFLRTAKSRRLRKRPSAFGAVREEALLLACLVVLVFAIWFATALPVEYLEVQLWLAMLAAQSLPYAAAVMCAAVARFSGERVG